MNLIYVVPSVRNVEHVLLSCCEYSRIPRPYSLSVSLKKALGDEETSIKRPFQFLRRWIYLIEII